MKDNKINGNNKNKTMTDFQKKNITLIDDDEANMHSSLVNNMLLP